MSTQNILAFLYNFWKLLAAISAIIGVITLLPNFWVLPNADDDTSVKRKPLKRSQYLISIIMAFIFVLSFLVGVTFTEVPHAYGGNVFDAAQTLQQANLNISLEPGVNLDDNWDTHTTGQANEGNIVPKGLEITIYTSLPDVVMTAPSFSEGEIVVPNVVGMEQIEATEYLVSIGLQFQVWWTEENNISAEHYYIIDQSIPEGSTVPAGTLIRLELSVTEP